MIYNYLAEIGGLRMIPVIYTCILKINFKKNTKNIYQ